MSYTLRIKDLVKKADKNASDDYIVIDGPNFGTRKMLVKDINKSEISDLNKYVHERKFKPHLWHSLYVRNNLNDNTTSRDKSLISSDVENFKDFGVEGLWVPVHIGYNSTSNNLYYQINIDTLDYVFNDICPKNDMPIIGIKFHQDYTLTDIFTMGETAFKSRVKNMFNEITDRYAGKFEYVGVFNEWRHFYKKDGFVHDGITYNYVPFVVECIEMMKAKGLKCGVSLAGYHPGVWSSWDECDKEVLDAANVLLTNAYPSVGNKQYYSIEDVIDAWDATGLRDMIEYSKIYYNGEKKVIVTESGCADSFRAYFQPSSTTVCDPNKPEANGEAVSLYIEGMFRSHYKDSDILEGVTWWFSLLRGGEKTKKIIYKYLGGKN